MDGTCSSSGSTTPTQRFDRSCLPPTATPSHCREYASPVSASTGSARPAPATATSAPPDPPPARLAAPAGPQPRRPDAHPPPPHRRRRTPPLGPQRLALV